MPSVVKRGRVVLITLASLAHFSRESVIFKDFSHPSGETAAHHFQVAP